MKPHCPIYVIDYLGLTEVAYTLEEAHRLARDAMAWSMRADHTEEPYIEDRGFPEGDIYYWPSEDHAGRNSDNAIRITMLPPDVDPSEREWRGQTIFIRDRVGDLIAEMQRLWCMAEIERDKDILRDLMDQIEAAVRQMEVEND